MFLRLFIIIGGTPYPTMNNSELLTHLKEGYRMKKPDNCAQPMYVLLSFVLLYQDITEF